MSPQRCSLLWGPSWFRRFLMMRRNRSEIWWYRCCWVVVAGWCGGRGGNRPRAKHLEGIGGARSGRSRVGSTKKREVLGSSCHVGHGSATLFVGATERKKLRKPGLMSATEKPAQTRQEKKMNFFLVQSTRTQPEATDRHRQTPLRAHPNTPQNRLFAAGGSTTAPLARGRSTATSPARPKDRPTDRRRAPLGGRRALLAGRRGERRAIGRATIAARWECDIPLPSSSPRCHRFSAGFPGGQVSSSDR